jgi:hypothetical protein
MKAENLSNFQIKISEELEQLKNDLILRDVEIYNLKEELTFVKEERNENIYQVHSILKDYDYLGKFPNQNQRTYHLKVKLRFNYREVAIGKVFLR